MALLEIRILDIVFCLMHCNEVTAISTFLAVYCRAVLFELE